MLKLKAEINYDGLVVPENTSFGFRGKLKPIVDCCSAAIDDHVNHRSGITAPQKTCVDFRLRLGGGGGWERRLFPPCFLRISCAEGSQVTPIRARHRKQQMCRSSAGSES